jgi:hypothetical protein
VAYGSSKTNGFLARFGESVTLGGTTVNGLIDVVDLAPSGPEHGQLVGRYTRAVVKVGALPGLVQGAAVTIRSASYKVQELRLGEDGELVEVYCAKA